MASTSWTLDNTIGALLIGVIFAIFLFGIITLQTHLYFRRFAASDPWKLKVLVGFIRVKIPLFHEKAKLLQVGAVWCVSLLSLSTQILNASASRILELLHTIGICFELYRSTITLFGQPQKLFRFPILGGITLVGGFITLVTQVRVKTSLPSLFDLTLISVSSLCASGGHFRIPTVALAFSAWS